MEVDFLDKYLRQIEDIFETSKPVPFSGKIAVDKKEIYDIIDQIRLSLPNELKESQKLLKDKDRILRDTERHQEIKKEESLREAQEIIRRAEDEAIRLTSEHEIYKNAVEEATLLMDEAQREAKNIRINAMDYADEVLSKAEQAMRDTVENIDKQHNAAQEYYYKVLDVLYENRQALRGGSDR